MDKLQRYCWRFCSLVVLLAVFLTPFSAYADDAVTDGTLVDIIIRNPTNITGSVWHASTSIDQNFSDASKSQQFDASQFIGSGYMVVDYVLTLPFAIPANSYANIAWYIQGLSGASIYASYPYDVPLSSRFNMYWGEAERIEVIVDGTSVGEYRSPLPIVLKSDYQWQQISTENVDVPDGINKTFTYRFWMPFSAIRQTSGNTFGDFITTSTYLQMSCSVYLPESTLLISYRENESASDGLLQGIIEWLRGILESITQLPQNIWSYVENGLKSLFVPDAEFMESYKSEWDTVLQDSMGGVYQSVSMIDDFYESFKVSSTQGTIYFPEVNVPVAGETFTFGGYEVDVVPDEAPFLQIVIDGIKLVMNAVCTLAVLQSFKRRYERVVAE